MQGIGVFDTLFSLLLSTLAYTKSDNIAGTQDLTEQTKV